MKDPLAAIVPTAHENDELDRIVQDRDAKIVRFRERATRPAARTPAPAAPPVPDGFMRAYVDWAKDRTDAPEIFHTAVAYSVLATACGNRLVLELEHQRVLPHLWVVLVAPSSYFRKSTAIGYGSNILQRADPELIIPNDFSRERFLAYLAQKPYGFLSASEFASFISAISRDYNGGLKECITDLYDSPTSWRRMLQKESIEIKEPSFSIVGGSTIEWLKSTIQAGDVKSGFAARLTFWPAREKLPRRPIRVRRSGSLSFTVQDSLVAQLGQLSRQPAAALDIDDDAMDHYNKWQEQHEEEQVSDLLRGFHVRLETVALKIAMLAEVSATALAWPRSIGLGSMQIGTQTADALWRNVGVVIEEGLGSSAAYVKIERIRAICQTFGGEIFSWSELLAKSKDTARDLTPLTDTLIQTGELVPEADASEHRGPKAKLFSYHPRTA